MHGQQAVLLGWMRSEGVLWTHRYLVSFREPVWLLGFDAWRSSME